MLISLVYCASAFLASSRVCFEIEVVFVARKDMMRSTSGGRGLVIVVLMIIRVPHTMSSFQADSTHCMHKQCWKQTIIIDISNFGKTIFETGISLTLGFCCATWCTLSKRRSKPRSSLEYHYRLDVAEWKCCASTKVHSL